MRLDLCRVDVPLSDSDCFLQLSTHRDSSDGLP